MLMKEKFCTNGIISRCTYPILLLVALMSLAFSSTVLAQTATPKHGISIVKGCIGETAVGDPMYCNYTIRNNVDEGDGTVPLVRHTLTFNYIEDIVCTGGTGGVPGGCIGKVSDGGVPTFSGNIISNLEMTFSNEEGGADAFCDAGATGNSLCTLPPGGRIDTEFYSHYNVAIDDADPLPDVVVLRWVDLCVPEPAQNNCPQQEQEQTTGSSTQVTCAACVNDAECEACNESTNLCEPFSASTSCTDDGSNECADAGCDGSGTCVQDHTPVSASTTCTSDGSLECWDAGCDGSGNCV